MVSPFFDVPVGARYALRHVNVPACLLSVNAAAEDAEVQPCDLVIDAGVLVGVEPAGSVPEHLGPHLDGSLVLPGLVDCHTHLDKGHIWPRQPNPTGDGLGAAHATGVDRQARWNVEDVQRRMEFGLQTAYAHGTVAIRTHIDSLAPQAGISFPVFKAMRERWAGRIELQASSIAPIDIFLTDEGRALADTVADAGGQLGCVTRFRGLPNHPLPEAFDVAMGNLFQLAAERGLDVDLHVDESTDPRMRTLIRVAQLARRGRFQGDLWCGHCSSLALQTEAFIERTLEAGVQAELAVVTLPTVNMYLQSRQAGTTPRWRGVTLVHEMRARGLRVAVAGDNCRDPFYAYGDHDMLDTYTQAVKTLHLDHPLADGLRMATAVPAAMMGLERTGLIRAGEPADLLVLRARNYSEMLARHQSDRVVLRRGRAIDTTLPDYRLLDDLMAA